MKKVLAISFLVLFTAFLSAQEQESVLMPKDLEWKLSLGFVPQYAIVSGMRLDLDVKIKQNQYLTFAPQMYYNKNYTQFYPDKTDMKGAGMNVNYRFIFSRTEVPEGAYIGFGLVYKYFDLAYDGDVWVNFTENDNIQQELRQQLIQKEFNQFGYDLLIGYQGTYERFFFDFYLGWGFRFSDFDEKETDHDFWGETIFDPGYEGFLPTLGFRAGIFLK